MIWDGIFISFPCCIFFFFVSSKFYFLSIAFKCAIFLLNLNIFLGKCNITLIRIALADFFLAIYYKISTINHQILDHLILFVSCNLSRTYQKETVCSFIHLKIIRTRISMSSVLCLLASQFSTLTSATAL